MIIILIPVISNVTKKLCVTPQYCSKYYLHPMKVFALYNDNNPEQLLHFEKSHEDDNINTDNINLIQNFICDKSPLIKLIKKDEKYELYLLLYKAENSNIKFSEQCISNESINEGSIWKWRTFNHFFTPWEESPGSQSDDDNDGNKIFENKFIKNEYINKDEDEREYENIDVYDFIMDETIYNKYHMNILYPLVSNKVSNKETLDTFSLYDICDNMSKFSSQ